MRESLLLALPPELNTFPITLKTGSQALLPPVQQLCTVAFSDRQGGVGLTSGFCHVHLARALFLLPTVP